MTLTIDLPDEEIQALNDKARAQGVSAEQYVRLVLEDDLKAKRARPPVSQSIREIWSDMPVDVRAKLPLDGASQVDHYVYGLPKRDQ
jgi:plasmid stability protein